MIVTDGCGFDDSYMTYLSISGANVARFFGVTMSIGVTMLIVV